MASIKPKVSVADLEPDPTGKYWFEQRNLVLLQLLHQLALGAKDAMFRLANKLAFTAKTSMLHLFHLLGFTAEAVDLGRQVDTPSCRNEQLERKVGTEVEKRRKIEPTVPDDDDFLGTGDVKVNCTEHGQKPCTFPSATKRCKLPIRRRGTRRVATKKKGHAILLKCTELELRVQKMEYQLRYYEVELHKEVDRAASIEMENVALKKDLKEVYDERERQMDAASRAEEVYKRLEKNSKKGGKAIRTCMTAKNQTTATATASELLNMKKNPGLGSNKEGKSKKPSFLKQVLKCCCF